MNMGISNEQIRFNNYQHKINNRVKMNYEKK